MGQYEYRNPFEHLVSVTDEYSKLVPLFEESVIPLLSATEALLDVGAGPGLVATPLSAHFERVGIVEPDTDYCLETVNKILSAGKLVTAFNGLWEAAQLGDLQFDLIICSHVLYFVDRDKWDGFLQKMVRHIRPGGRMAIVLTAKGDQVSEIVRRSLGIENVGAYPFSAGVIEFARKHGHSYEVVSMEATITTKMAGELEEMLTLFPIMHYDNGSTKKQRLEMIQNNFQEAGNYRLPYTVDIVSIEAPDAVK